MATAELETTDTTASLRDLVPDFDRIANCEDKTWIIEQIHEVFGLTVRHITRMAVLLRRADELSIEVDIQFAGLPILLRVGYGNVVPELYIAFEDDFQLMNRLAQLTTPDQLRIANGDPLLVAVQDTVGAITNVMLPVRKMTRDQVSRVFDRGRIRSEVEQANMLREHLAKRPGRQPIESLYEVDSKRGVVRIREGEYTSDILLKMIEELGRKPLSRRRSA